MREALRPFLMEGLNAHALSRFNLKLKGDSKMTLWNLFDYYEIHKFTEQVKPLIQNLGNAKISASLAKVEEILNLSDVKHSLEAFQRARKFTDSELLDRWTDLYYALCIEPELCVGADDEQICAILENELLERGMEPEMDRVIQEASAHLEKDPLRS
jgi:hypothetical protein